MEQLLSLEATICTQPNLTSMTSNHTSPETYIKNAVMSFRTPTKHVRATDTLMSTHIGKTFSDPLNVTQVGGDSVPGQPA